MSPETKERESREAGLASVRARAARSRCRRSDEDAAHAGATSGRRGACGDQHRRIRHCSPCDARAGARVCFICVRAHDTRAHSFRPRLRQLTRSRFRCSE